MEEKGGQLMYARDHALSTPPSAQGREQLRPAYQSQPITFSILRPVYWIGPVWLSRSLFPDFLPFESLVAEAN